jgi:hypothetical protein
LLREKLTLSDYLRFKFDMLFRVVSFFAFLTTLSSDTYAQAQAYCNPTRFSLSPCPPPPQYTNPDHWCALPTKNDPSDDCPRGLTNNQANAPADVFFIHPTTYTEKPKSAFLWNQDLRDASLNKAVDESPIRFQASAFNAAGKIYAPRYRQAHYSVFLTPHKDDKQAALDTAYHDVEQAFLYYLAHWNQGRPIIIASHSQGTIHAARIIKEHILGTPLQKQLVATYLVGMPVPYDSLPGLPACANDSATGCFLSWSSYERGFIPPYYPLALERAVCVNPISWELNENYVPKTDHAGAVLRPFSNTLPQICDAQVHGGILWITKPKFPGSRFYTDPNYHIGDINLFYLDVRRNATKRVETFMKHRH